MFPASLRVGERHRLEEDGDAHAHTNRQGHVEVVRVIDTKPGRIPGQNQKVPFGYVRGDNLPLVLHDSLMPKPLVTDELWEVSKPLLPEEPPKPKGERPHVPYHAALTGILFVLKTGTLWEMPGEMGCGSGMTC